MKYRPEIDGLRALAVIPVILFHAGFELFSGGFVGVDVFFVISGYLITTILIDDIENKRFSIINFYEKRARRILPAMFFVMLVCIPFAWMLMMPSQMTDFSQSLVAVSLFSSNILFWLESDYFAAATEQKPLLHTWSLAVEEQYYVLFPIFLILAWRYGKNRAFGMIVVMAAISLLLSEWGWRNKTSANFYLAPTRAWELLAGSITAFIVQKRGVQKNNFLALLGLSAIIFSIFAYDEGTPFPSVYALLPVVGVVLLVMYAEKDTFAARLLSTKVFVGVGLISYSAYLWHQPLFAFARIRLIEHPSLTLMLSLSVAAIILAYLSYRYVEQPFRNKGQLSRSRIFIISILGISFFTCVGLAGHFYPKEFEKIWLSRQTLLTQNMYEVLSKPSNWSALDEDTQEKRSCIFNVTELNEELERKILECREQYDKGILIIGDSHAIDLFGSVDSRREHPFLIGVTQGGCRLHNNYDHCQYDRVVDFLNAHPATFRVVIYEQAGFYLLRERDGTKGSRSMFTERSIGERIDNVVVDEEHINLVLEFLYALSDTIKVNWFLPRAEPHIARSFILKNGCNYQYSYRPNLYETFEVLDTYIDNLVRERFEGRINTVSQNQMYNFDFPSDFMNCDTIYWTDGDHLSASGEEYFGKRLTSELLE